MAVTNTQAITGVQTTFTVPIRIFDDSALTVTITPSGEAPVVVAFGALTPPAGSGATSHSIPVPDALGITGTITFSYDIGAVGQQNSYTDAGGLRGAALQKDMGNLYDKAVIADATTTEVETARGVEASLDDRLTTIETDATAVEVRVTAAEGDIDDLEGAVAGLQAGSGLPVGTEGQVITYNGAGVAVASSNPTILAVLNFLFDLDIFRMGGDGRVRLWVGSTTPPAGQDEWRICINCDGDTIDTGVSPATIEGLDNNYGLMVVRFVANATSSAIEIYYALAGWAVPAELTLMARFGVAGGTLLSQLIDYDTAAAALVHGVRKTADFSTNKITPTTSFVNYGVASALGFSTTEAAGAKFVVASIEHGNSTTSLVIGRTYTSADDYSDGESETIYLGAGNGLSSNTAQVLIPVVYTNLGVPVVRLKIVQSGGGAACVIRGYGVIH